MTKKGGRDDKVRNVNVDMCPGCSTLIDDVPEARACKSW